jgi:hypothetical protein
MLRARYICGRAGCKLPMQRLIGSTQISFLDFFVRYRTVGSTCLNLITPVYREGATLAIIAPNKRPYVNNKLYFQQHDENYCNL